MLSLITTALNSATSAASSLTAGASGLIAAANQSLNYTLDLTPAGPWQYPIKPHEVPYTQTETVEGLPPIPNLDLPKPPNFTLSGIAPPGGLVGEAPWPDAPDWTFAPFQRPEPSPPPADPILDEGVFSPSVLPSPPDTAFSPPPSLLSVAAVPAADLTFPTLDLPVYADPVLPVADPDAEARMRSLLFGGTAGVPGYDGLSDRARDFAEHARAVLVPVLGAIDARFADRHAPVFVGKEEAIEALADARLTALDARLAEDIDGLIERSGWVLPAPVAAALRRRVLQQESALLGERGDKKALRVMDQARQMMEFCRELHGSLRGELEALRKAEIDATLAAHDAAVRLAREKIDTLAKIFDADNFRKYDLRSAYAEARLAVFESEIEAERLQYDAVAQKLENEKLKQAQDAALIEQYESEIATRGTRLNVMNAQVRAARAEIELQTFAVERFRTRIDLFSAKVRADEVRVRRMLSEIEGNETELKRLTAIERLYETQVRAYEMRIDAQAKEGDKLQDRNELQLAAYEAHVKAESLPVEVGLMDARQKLAIHEMNAKIYRRDADLARRLQKIDMDFLNDRRDLRRDLIKTFQDLAVDAANTELGRMQAVAQVNASGARVLATMAEGAMSAMTAVGGGVVEELAA